MRLLQLLVTVTAFALPCYPVQAYTLTFDGVPAGQNFAVYYSNAYGINLEWPVVDVADHTGCRWGPPRSGTNVLVVTPGFGGSMLDTMFKGLGATSRAVCSFGAFFSTEQDVVLQMVGYDGSFESPVSSIYIGSQGESWKNRYVEVSSLAGNISMVEIYPVSADAFHHFCLDDLTVVPLPEPSSLLALLAGLGGLGGVMWRRRSRA